MQITESHEKDSALSFNALARGTDKLICRQVLNQSPASDAGKQSHGHRSVLASSRDDAVGVKFHFVIPKISILMTRPNFSIRKTGVH